MAKFNGKWKVISTENVEEFSRSIGMPEEWVSSRMAMDDINNDLIDEITITDTDFILAMHMKGEERNRHCTPLNKEVEQKFLDGRDAKITVVITDDKYVKTQKGDNFTATYTRTIDGDVMTLVMSSDKGVTATRKLKKM